MIQFNNFYIYLLIWFISTWKIIYLITLDKIEKNLGDFRKVTFQNQENRILEVSILKYFFFVIIKLKWKFSILNLLAYI